VAPRLPGGSPRSCPHAELAELFATDQADRASGVDGVDWALVAPRDLARRRRVLAILDASGAQLAVDYYRAAMIFQHGETVADIELARALALTAVRLDPSDRSAQWLAAATLDRIRLHRNEPQLYGTQSTYVDGAWALWPVSPLLTDADRAAWNVPPLAETEARIAAKNAD
jgi:hypothetical protein